MNLEFEGEILAPETRAAILAETLRFLACRMEPVRFDALLSHIMKAFQAREEEVAIEVYKAFFVLAFSGLTTSNTVNVVEKSATLSSETVISPSRRLTSFVWDDQM
ncbi:hypothetical protein [Agrobacterium tumefaciens]|uniref:hypothetical protein n=1 Tax=Agrobacterium tumefaciens TaxID=358 RepID=UPI0021D23AE2|nr:hypothetical protein [Agrobacterium tumefaciens]UXS09222.1 hypothetical protein FY155_06215 [Agrobacterium tumefaciens]UXS16581.1 hypothetical protein FY154_06210 [Agrobacterium tumefaciens]